MSLSILDLLSGWGISFMLVLTRVSAMMYAFPFFGSPAIAMRVRILMTLVISFLVLPQNAEVYLPVVFRNYQ